MDMELDTSLSKRGELCISSTIQRSRKHNGLLVRVKTVPPVEALFRDWTQEGEGEINSVSAYGRHWAPVDGADLRIYPMRPSPGIIMGDEVQFRLDTPGFPLMEGKVVNLSFLRIVGISEGPGVEFVVKGVTSTEWIEQVGKKIQAAQKMLYLTYLRPVTLHLSVFTSIQEVK